MKGHNRDAKFIFAWHEQGSTLLPTQRMIESVQPCLQLKVRLPRQGTRDPSLICFALWPAFLSYKWESGIDKCACSLTVEFRFTDEMFIDPSKSHNHFNEACSASIL